MSAMRNDRPPADKTKRAAKTIPRIAALVIVSVILGGCASLLGGGDKESATLYVLDPRIAPDPSWPKVDWQLLVSKPTAARVIDTLRIVVSPTPEELEVYKGASWTKLPSDMVEDTVTRALEDSGDIGGVARQGTSVPGDYKLVMDMRRFEADYAGNPVPSATIEVNVKLLHSIDQRVVASRTFLHAEPAAGTDVKQVVDAFSRGLERIGHDMVGWVLVNGDTHQRTAHPK